MPTRTYLDQTVVPILLQGLGVLAKERFELLMTYLTDLRTVRSKDSIMRYASFRIPYYTKLWHHSIKVTLFLRALY